MSLSRKYGRTYHYPFSPGTSSDDRINHNYWEDLVKLRQVVHTEKLDGENTCLNKYGVFARSHAAPTTHPWASYLKQKWESIRHDLGELEIFGENLYAVHSIEYQDFREHFYVFGIREREHWLSWEETKFYANMLDFAMVPELAFVEPVHQAAFEDGVLALVNQASVFGSVDTITKEPCTMEGIVTRSCDEYPVEQFRQHVFKYVRKGHIKTNEHWSRNWQRAPLTWEKKD